MRVPRIYTDDLLTDQQTIMLDKSKSHYLARVLRKTINDPVILFNSQDGLDHTGHITQVQRDQVTIKLNSQQDNQLESSLSIHIGQAISKGEKLDLVIQKASELGVSSLTPLLTERSHMNKANVAKKHAHLQKVAISAAEQCGRSMVVQIYEPTLLGQWLQDHQNQPAITLNPTGEATIGTDLFPTTPENICVLIGPEGGLTDAEVKQATQVGFKNIRLGPRILRTETAPLAIVTLLQHLWGDF